MKRMFQQFNSKLNADLLAERTEMLPANGDSDHHDVLEPEPRAVSAIDVRIHAAAGYRGDDAIGSLTSANPNE
jgi:hypothetical protein